MKEPLEPVADSATETNAATTSDSEAVEAAAN